jgi:hypothetical protein
VEPISDIDIFALQVARCARKHGFWLTHLGHPSKEDAYRTIDMRRLRNNGYGVDLYPSISIIFDYDEKKWSFFLRITLRRSATEQITRTFGLRDVIPALKLIDDFASRI